MNKKEFDKLFGDKGFVRGADGQFYKRSALPAPAVPTSEPKAMKKADPPKDPHRKFLVIATISGVMPRDYDGLGAAVKGIIDRLVELKEIPIPSDGPEYLEVICEWRKVSHYKFQKTVLEIYALPTNWHSALP